jgi:hypothetical protein
MPGFSDWLKILQPYVEAGGTIAGGIAKNRAAGRAQENLTTGAADRTAIDRYTAEELAKREALKLQEDAVKDRADRYLESGRTRAGQAAFGDALANLQDVSLEGLPSDIPMFSFSGGLRPSVFGAGARSAGQTLSRDALAAMLSGADVPDLPVTSGIGRNAPAATPFAEANALDKILEAGGYAAQAAGTVGEIQRQRAQQRAAMEARRPQGPVGTGAIADVIAETPTALPGYTPAPGTTIAGRIPSARVPGAAGTPGTIELLAQLKAQEDLARARGGRG